jgi:hypothetical protein
MAHFAQLDDDNRVLQVIVVSNEDAGPLPGEQGEAFCTQLLGGRWKQTSYNTVAGVHQRGGNPFRKNYAGIGYTYDAQRDAFIPPKPTPEAVFDEPSCTWRAPGAPVTE